MTKLIAAAIAGMVAFAAITVGGSAADEARIRVIHASPDAPNVDVYANGDKVLSDVPFPASSGYLTVPAGSYTFEVFAAGADPSTDSAVLTIPAELAAGTDYTVVALNEVASIEAAVFVDDNTAPAAGKAHITVIHAGPDAPAVDVAVTGGPVLVSDLSLTEGAGPLPVDAGNYDLEIRPAGTTDVALAVPGVGLEAGYIYTFVATGFLAGEPALTVEAYQEAPRAHMTPPSTGDAGLAASQGGSSAYLIGAVALLAIIAVAGVARRAAVRG